MARPLFNKTTDELRSFVERNKNNPAELALVKSELRYRKTLAAKDLASRVEKLLVSEATKPAKKPTKAKRKATPAPHPSFAVQADDSMCIPAAPTVLPTNEPLASKEQGEMTEEQRQTLQEVAALRTKLIDLGKRNPLISFRHGSRSASHIRIVDERPDLLFEALQRGPLGFEPLPDEDVVPQDEQTDEFQIAYELARLTDADFLAATEDLGDDEADVRAWQVAERRLRQSVRLKLDLPKLEYGKALDVRALAQAHGFDPSFDLRGSDDEDVAEHHNDDRIRVLLTAKELEKRTKGIYEKYRMHERETGLHTLYLCLGFVQWFEDEASDVFHHAPALMLQVRLEQRVSRGRYEYKLSIGDEGLEVNVALQEKMRQQWGLEAPQLRENETPESYFVRLNSVLEQGRRLSLRRFATIAVLPFPRMVLWKDLDPSAWGEEAFGRHPLLPGLLSANSFSDDPAPLDAPDIDAEPIASTAPPLIQPADASQHAALIDVAEGKSLAIEGPPGTGKSQTITNMIASALKDGKRVLFVAEKQAALSVVASRLRKAGFGPLLLELHGDTAKRDTVYQGLRERFAAKPSTDAAKLAEARSELARKRDMIRRYISLIREPLGSLGRNAYQLVWREIRLRNSLPEGAAALCNRWLPEDVTTLDYPALKDHRSVLDSFARALADLRGSNAETLWQKAEKLSPFDQRTELAAASAAAQVALRIASLQDSFAALGLALPGPRAGLDAALLQTGGLRLPEDPRPAVFKAALREPERSRELIDTSRTWQQIHTELMADVTEPARVTFDDVAALAESLASLEQVPATLASAKTLLADICNVEQACRSTQADLAELARQLHWPQTLLTSQVRVMVEVVDLLAQFPAVNAALVSEFLLDPLSRAALDREAAAAQAIVSERGELTSLLQPEAFEADPTELSAMADTLEQAGVVERLFGSEFKAVQRRTRAWSREVINRQQAIELLRRAARHLRRERTFAADSQAKSLFPALLWQGAGSDFAAALDVAKILDDSMVRLREAEAADVLADLVKLGSSDRIRMGDLARKVAPALEAACAIEEDAVPALELAQAIEQRRVGMQRLVTSLENVGAQEDGMIVRDGVDVGVRLGRLLEAKQSFDRLSQHDAFAWIASVGDDLQPLVDALECAECLGGADAPLAIQSVARIAEDPLFLLQRLMDVATDLAQAHADWISTSGAFASATGIDASLLADDWRNLSCRLEELGADAEGARAVAELLKYRGSVRAAGLDPLAGFAMAAEVSCEALADLYEWMVVQSLVREYLGGTGEELGRLGGLSLESARAAFTAIDEQLQGLEAASIVAERLRDKAPWGVDKGRVGDFTEGALINHELGLRRSRTSLREVTHRAARALQALKPVWMMSPTSAAQYIRPNSVVFDLLVIDEASQMRPEFAVSAIMRAQQIVVVGDANQLPPSDFFASATMDDDDGDDVSATADSESILDLANQRLRRKRRLRWHYRSQHEALINFSNREFYERDLIVFPSPTTDDELLGVKCEYVGGSYEASINQQEAQAVIEEAYRLMCAYPDHSLGIATMNIKQAELIRAEFDRLMLERPEVREYMQYHGRGIEEFFVKNLENVQGDERDIILISTVYGPDKNGAVMQRFGPLTQQVGWRRLNVLITRAKLSTRVFTSLKPSDIKITEKSSRGVLALKSFLTYAMNGATVDDDTGGEPDSDFEVFVAEKLRSHGYEVVGQVGVEGFRIDLGVRHPDYPLGFIAGIECDGARWHTGMSVRDRDRIRQTILEGMGWRIHRIWSTDWFANPDREMAKLLEKLEQWRAQAMAAYEKRPRTQSITETSEEDQKLAAAPPEPSATSYAAPLVSDQALAVPDKIDAENDDDEPLGKAMRPLDGIEWFELAPGKRYAVVIDGERAGTVEVVSRAVAAPRLYGGAIAVPKSEFDGWVRQTGERFRMHDIYATVREVARRAKQVARSA